jgi:hypothetical protein
MHWSTTIFSIDRNIFTAYRCDTNNTNKDHRMKITSLTELAEFLRNLPNGPDAEIGFDMSNSQKARFLTDHPCGSACCIGGWVNLQNGTDYGVARAVRMIAPDYIEVMEITALCFPSDVPEAWGATPQQAARAVEILEETGQCDWERAMAEVPA